MVTSGIFFERRQDHALIIVNLGLKTICILVEISCDGLKNFDNFLKCVILFISESEVLIKGQNCFANDQIATDSLPFQCAYSVVP